jgi:hypothetical protein
VTKVKKLAQNFDFFAGGEALAIPKGQKIDLFRITDDKFGFITLCCQNSSFTKSNAAK